MEESELINEGPEPTEEQMLEQVERISEEIKDRHQEGDISKYMERAGLYMSLEECEKAVEDYNKCLEVEPDSMHILFSRSVAYLGSNKNEEALEDVQKWMDLAEKTMEGEEMKVEICKALCMKGSIYADLKRDEEALECFKKSQTYVDDYAVNYLLQIAGGRSLEHEKDGIAALDDCLQVYDMVVQLQPKNPDWIGIALRNRGACYSKKNEHEKAIEDLTCVIEKYPKMVTPSVYFWRSSSFLHIGKYEEVEKDTSFVIDDMGGLKTNHFVYFLRGESRLQLGKVEEAIVDLTKSLELAVEDESKGRVLEKLGVAHFRVRQYPLALQYWERCLEKDLHRTPTVYFGLGVIYSTRFNLTKREDSLRCLEQCVELSPTFVQGWMKLVEVSFSLQQWKKCEDACDVLIDNKALDKEDVWKYRVQKGKCMSRMNKYKEAIDQFNLVEQEVVSCLEKEQHQEEEAFGLSISSSDSTSEKIKSFVSPGRYISEDNLEQIMSLPPTTSNFFEKSQFCRKILDPVFYISRSRCYTATKQYESAIRDVNLCMELFPQYKRCIYERGNIYFSSKQYDLAILDYKIYLDNHMEETFKYFVLNDIGFTYRRLGQFDKSLHYYQLSIDNNSTSTNFDGFRGRGTTYVKLSQYQKAIEDFTTAMKLLQDMEDKEQEMSSCLNSRGYVYTVLKKYDLAMKDLDNSVLLRPQGFANSYNHRGYLFYLLGQYDRAMQDYEKSLEIRPNYKEAKERRSLCVAKIDRAQRISFLIDEILLVEEGKFHKVVLKDEKNIFFFPFLQ